MAASSDADSASPINVAVSGAWMPIAAADFKPSAHLSCWSAAHTHPSTVHPASLALLHAAHVLQGRNSQIHIFNGRPVESLLQLAREVVTCDEPFMAFGVDHNVRRRTGWPRVAGRQKSTQPSAKECCLCLPSTLVVWQPSLPLQEEVVLETAAVANATAEVMAVHAIPSFASKDIVEALAKEGLLKEAGI